MSRRRGAASTLAGLALLAGSFLWIAQVSATIPYTIIVIQMLMIANRYEWKPAIVKAQEDGQVVVADRYLASSVAYGEAQGLDPDWLFEVKWDGYRVQARVRAGAVRARTRTGRDAAAYLAGALEPPEWIDADEAIVDGELVALRPDGTPDFGLLQERIGHAGRWLERSDRQVELSGPSVLAYEVFDLLYLDGRLLLDVPLEGRKELLRRAVREHPVVRFAGHVQGDGESFFRAAVERGLEGAVAKHRRSRYLPGRRSSAWLKLKARPEQEFVVAGYARGTASHADLGSLLLAVDEGNGLRYAGRVGSGIDALTRSRLRAELDRRATSGPAVAEVPSAELHDPAVRWVEPGPVVRVRFAGWTRDGVIRQSSFSGVDADRASGGVVRERPIRSSPSHAPVVPAAELAEEHAAGEGDTAERQHAGSQDRAAGGHRAERRHAAHQTPKERQVSDEHHSTERRRAADEPDAFLK